ncbi:cytochrome P450 [Xenorhabdus vietnamensis]|uniref:Cytochrome P450 n=1 Tax=Xenorhabdus vietnamensis TaxID=351656 RepID=A0A1Y2S789_9GAMM|nr:cytochrome P450 [Xenorhabdus vietnamensis]OTA14522.1 cytochrome P450 [Xenorhabdus vietnamensis]
MSTTLHCHRVSNRTLQAKGILKAIEQAYRPDCPMFTLKFDNGSQILILADYRHVEYWLEHDDHFTKEMRNTRTSSALGRIQFGQSLTFAQDGEEWRQLRTLAMPTVNPKHPGLMQANQEAAQWLSECFSDIPVIDDAWSLCLEWATRCVLAPYLGHQTSVDTAIALIRHHQEVFFHLVQQAEHHDKAALYLDPRVHAFRTEIAQILDAALCHPDRDESTLLGQLAKHLDIEHNPAQKAFLTDFLMGNLLGSVDNPASTLLWCLIHLARNPEVIAQIRQESHNMAHRGWSIQRSPVTIAAIKECLRLSPVQPLVERCTSRNIILDGVTIAKGTHVLFCSWLIHRDPQCWPLPLEFDIERFMQRQRLNPAKYFPFGVGPRICAGMSLTLHQLVMCLLTLCRDHDWSLSETVTPLQLRPEFKLNLRPRGPISLHTTTDKTGQFQEEYS